MQVIRLRLRIYVAGLLAAVLIGTIGFTLLEKLSLFDAFYITIVTVTTVGYGDIHPVTTAGKGLAIFIIILGVGSFVGAIANAAEMALSGREERARLERLNMVIGAFFSEVGTYLLIVLSDADPNLDNIRSAFALTSDWTGNDFAALRARLRAYRYTVEIGKLDLPRLRTFLSSKRDFLVRLLENPSLMENEEFTDLLWAVFHLAEELAYRDEFHALPSSDLAHLAGDSERAYDRLVAQWLSYMSHLKARYPYLFSLALRTNPFDRQASPIVE
jgi:voltage-gated potassium channel